MTGIKKLSPGSRVPEYFPKRSTTYPPPTSSSSFSTSASESQAVIHRHRAENGDVVDVVDDVVDDDVYDAVIIISSYATVVFKIFVLSLLAKVQRWHSSLAATP
eukprot:3868147-Rhodomonas_salina.2